MPFAQQPPDRPASARSWWGAVFDPRPVLVAVLALLIVGAFVETRLHRVLKGDVSLFASVGQAFANESELPPGVTVVEGEGYDGQFFWRLAADPSDLDTDPSQGLRLDLPLRSQRIGYPAASWLVALGSPGRVPVALVLVNVLALAALAWLGGIFARDAGHPTMWGLLLVLANPAVWFSLSRDLSEPLAVAFLLGGLLAIRRDRALVAGLCWSAAVLTREQAMIAVAVLGAWRVVGLVRGRSRPARPDLAWIVPGFVFAGWQVVLLAVVGSVPLRSSGQSNLVLPFRDLVPAYIDWLRHEPRLWVVREATPNIVTFTEPVRALLEVPFVAILVGVAVAGSRTRTRGASPQGSSSRGWELGVVAALALLTVSLSSNVWTGPADLRTSVDLASFAWVLVLGLRRTRVALLLAVPGCVISVTAALFFLVTP